jgi:hypothetical protein
LAYGRFAPFYRWLYMLPYVSTVRNPAKFTHLVSFALVVLFAYGIDNLWRTHVQPAPAGADKSRLPSSPRADLFDKRWILGCALTFVFCAIACLVYAVNRAWLERYLLSVQFQEYSAKIISSFSILQPWWFLLFFGISALFTWFVLKGIFSGKQHTWGSILLGLILIVDLGRANRPWIIFWDYKEKYASNPILDILRDKPYEHRVALLPFNPLSPHAALRQLYTVDWSQHAFQYYNIQAADVMLAPRVPPDITLFNDTFHPENRDVPSTLSARAWRLTNTRYLLGIADRDHSLNRAFDPVFQRFQPVERFAFVPKPGIIRPKTADELNCIADPEGPYCLFEFTGALPRAKLYSAWQISTNDAETLKELASDSFDPDRNVLVSPPAGVDDPLLAMVPTNTTSIGSVDFVSYAPKHIVLSSQASAPSLLLLNDRYDSGWRVAVDGAPATLLRCNFLMRGVFLPVGAHTIEFRFRRPLRPLWISITGVTVGLLLTGILLISHRRDRLSIGAPKPEPSSPLRTESTPKAQPSTPPNRKRPKPKRQTVPK